MVKDYMLKVGDYVKIYLHDCVLEGKFVDECGIGIILLDGKDKDKYRLVPVESIQHLEYTKKGNYGKSRQI